MNLISLIYFLLLIAGNHAGIKDAQTGYHIDGKYDELIERAIKQASTDRPRVLMNSEDFDQLRERIDIEESVARIFEHYQNQANAVLDMPLLERVQVGRRMTAVSREAVRRMVLLGMVWQLTGEQVYAERMAEDLLAVSSFSDWNPTHFLCTAEMTFAVSLGYDWAFDVLDDVTKELVRSALVEKGLEPGLTTPSRKWTTNWGQVVNAGLSAGAVALLDEEPDISGQILRQAIHDIRNSTSKVFGPDGNYQEGSSYWDYGTFYNVIMIEVLETGLGNDFGLLKEPGFEKSGNYMLHVTGPSLVTFQWHFERRSSALIWFARRFGTSLLPAWSHETKFYRGDELDAWGAPDSRNNYRHPFALFWLPDKDYHIAGNPPLDWFGRGHMQVAMHRSSWDSQEALFLGIKAGAANYSHGFLDAGDFVLEYGGVRWARDRVEHPGRHPIEERGMSLWNYEQDSDRWKIFYKNNFSHNTLVIDDQLQIAAGQPKIISQDSSDDLPYTIVDLTASYEGQAERVHRTFAMPERRAVIIVDDIDGLKPGSRVRWAMVTDAEIHTNGNIATLNQDGKQLRMEISGDTDLKWEVDDMMEPPAEWDAPNPESSRLEFTAIAPEDGILQLKVQFTPVTGDPGPDAEWWQAYEKILQDIQL